MSKCAETTSAYKQTPNTAQVFSMTNPSDQSNRAILQRLAVQAMTDRGLLADFTAQAMSEAAGVKSPSCNGDGLPRPPQFALGLDRQRRFPRPRPAFCRRSLARRQDQSARGDRRCRRGCDGTDGDRGTRPAQYDFGLYGRGNLPHAAGTPLDRYHFAGPGRDRPAIVVEMAVAADGSVSNSSIYRAWVRNQAKLAYHGVAAWLGGGPAPAALATVNGLDANLRLQDKAAQALKGLRQQHGALTFTTNQSRAKFDGDSVTALELEQPDRATQLIEDFMVAANGVTAEFLEAKKFPCLRRVVRTPKRWDGIVDIARQHGTSLPAAPDAPALNAFLAKQKQADPDRFPDLSLAIIKLMGPGEYVAEVPGDTEALGHFGLAVEHYSHSTAPNRRYPDVITQRLLKAALAGRPAPMRTTSWPTWPSIAPIRKMRPRKSSGRSPSRPRRFCFSRGSASGSMPSSPAPATRERGSVFSIRRSKASSCKAQGLGVGRKLQVELLRTDVEHGFIDFKKVG